MSVEEINLAAFIQPDPVESQMEQEAAVQFAASNLFDLLPAGGQFPISPAGLAIPLAQVRSKLKEVSHINVRGAKDFLHELFRKVNLEEVEACQELRQRCIVVGEGAPAPASNCPIVVPSLKELESILRQGFGCVVVDNEGAIHYLQAFPPFTSRDFRSLSRHATVSQSPAGTPRSCDLCSGVFYSPKIGKCQLFSFNTDEILATAEEEAAGVEGRLPETILDALHTSMFSAMLEKRKPGIHRRTLLYLTAPAEWNSEAEQQGGAALGARTGTLCSGIYAPSVNSGSCKEEKVGGGTGAPVEANGEDGVKKTVVYPQKQKQEEEKRDGQKENLPAKSEAKIDQHQQSPQAAFSPPRLVPSILSWVRTMYDELAKGRNPAVGSALLDFSSQCEVTPGSTVSDALRLGAKIVLSVADGLEQLTHSLGSPKSGHLPDRLSLAGFQTFDRFVANLIYDGINLLTDVDVEHELQAVTLPLARSEQAAAASHENRPLEEGLRNFQEALSYLGQKNRDDVTGKVQVFHSLLATNHQDIGARSTSGQEGCETAKMLMITLVPESIAGGYIVIKFNLVPAPPSSSAFSVAKSGAAEYFFISSLNDLRLHEACRGTFPSQGQGSSAQNQDYIQDTPVVHLLGFKPTAVTSLPIQVRIPTEGLKPEGWNTGSPQQSIPSPAAGATLAKPLAGSPKNPAAPSGGGLSATTATSNGASNEQRLLTDIASKLQQIRTEKLLKLAALQGELNKVEEATATKKSELDALNADFTVLNGCEEKDRALDLLERQGESRGLQDSIRQVQKKSLTGRLCDVKLQLQKKREANEVTRTAVKANRERLMNDAKNASFSSPPRSSERGGFNSSQPRSGFQTSSSLPSSSLSSTSAEARKPSSSTSSTTSAASGNSVPKAPSSTSRPGTAPTASKPKTTAPLTDREYAMQLQRKQEEELRDYEYAKSLQFLQD